MSEFINKILKEGQNKFTPIPLNILKYIIEWVTDYSGRNVGANIKKLSHYLPTESQQGPTFIYRAIAIKKGKRLLMQPSITSWTNSIETAKQFGEDKKMFIEYYDTYLLRIKTESNRIICNLPLLSKTNVFNQSLEYYKKKGKLGDSILDNLDREDEIIYDQPKIDYSNLYLKMTGKGTWITL